MNDTVREELETKISPGAVGATSGKLSAPKPALPVQRAAPPKIEIPPPPAPPTQTHAPIKTQPPTHAPIKPPTPPPTAAPPKPIAARFETADLRVKKTSPTLVEFQTKKATVPEWRLQLQNSVRQKVGGGRRPDENATGAPQAKTKSTSGANALKVEYVEEEQQQPARHQNPRVASALKRIEESRRTFTNQPVAEQSLRIGKAAPATPRKHPFNVVARSNEAPVSKAAPKATVNPSPKPMLVSPLKIEKRGFDTNKLPPLEKPKESISTRLEVPAAKRESSIINKRNPVVEENAIENELLEINEEEIEEIEDLAPLSMRFNAGLFDMIIGLFATLILLSPFILSGGSWVSAAGFLAMTAALAIVMFLYLTISLAFTGRTFGMRLFSLELVDVEENEYPTLHQAAVNSSVYLLSLAFAGVGFLPLFFNEERRAAHDILSGTILIREY